MSSSAKSGQQHIHLDFPLLNSPLFAIAKSDQQHVHSDSPLLDSPLFTRSGSYVHNDGHRSSTVASASIKVVSSSVSVTKNSSASYHQEHLRSATLTNLRLTRNGTVITARWTTTQGIPKQSSLDLNLHIGNIDGGLCWGYSGFSKSCIDFDLNGTIFSASCRPRSWRGPEGYLYSELDLMEYLHISEGALCAHSFANCRLTCKSTVITAEWTTLQGITKQSSLNLDVYIGNVDGDLRWGEKDFSKSCVSWDLRGTIFYALCRPRTWSAEGYHYSELDLKKYLQISDGVLCIIKDVNPPSHVISSEPHASPSKLHFDLPVPHVNPSTPLVNKPTPTNPVKFDPHAPSIDFSTPSIGPSKPKTPVPSATPFAIDPPTPKVAPFRLHDGPSELRNIPSKPQAGFSEPRVDPSDPRDSSSEPKDVPSKPQESYSETHVISSESKSIESWTKFIFRQLKRMRKILCLSLARLLGRK